MSSTLLNLRGQSHIQCHNALTGHLGRMKASGSCIRRAKQRRGDRYNGAGCESARKRESCRRRHGYTTTADTYTLQWTVCAKGEARVRGGPEGYPTGMPFCMSWFVPYRRHPRAASHWRQSACSYKSSSSRSDLLCMHERSRTLCLLVFSAAGREA